MWCKCVVLLVVLIVVRVLYGADFRRGRLSKSLLFGRCKGCVVVCLVVVAPLVLLMWCGSVGSRLVSVRWLLVQVLVVCR